MTTRMSRARIRLPLLPELLSIGFCFGIVAGAMAGMSAADEAPRVAGQPVALAAAPVVISVSTLDMSRLVPAQFGDWDAPPER